MLVSPPYESHPEFFYPTPESNVIHTFPPDSRPYDTRDATITLAEIPFVRLRHGLDQRLKSGEASFSEVVMAAQRALGAPELVVDLAARTLVCGGQRVAMTPVNLALYAALARRRQAGEEPVERSIGGISAELLAALAAIVPPMSLEYQRTEQALDGIARAERTEPALWPGMNRGDFDQRKTRVNKALRRALGVGADPYVIKTMGGRPRTRFGLALPPEAIRIVPPSETATVESAAETRSH